MKQCQTMPVRTKTLGTPTASRTRVLPSTALLHQRLPRPPVLKSQTSTSTSSSPPVLRKLPTPPFAGQRTLPSTPATRQDHTIITVTGVTYPFKAPSQSPPASPKVQCWSEKTVMMTLQEYLVMLDQCFVRSHHRYLRLSLFLHPSPLRHGPPPVAAFCLVPGLSVVGSQCLHEGPSHSSGAAGL